MGEAGSPGLPPPDMCRKQPKSSPSRSSWTLLLAHAALAMGLIEKLTTKLGHAPNAAEIAAAKARRAAKKAAAEAALPVAPATPARVKLQILRSRLDMALPSEMNPEPKGKIIVLGGDGSTTRCLVTVTNNVPDVAIDDVRRFAGNAFGFANGWQIWLGSKSDDAVFLGGADGGAQSFKAEFEMLMMDKVKEPKAFAIECIKGTEGVRSSRPMQLPSGAMLSGDAKTVAEAVDDVLEGMASSAKDHAAKVAGVWM